LENAKQGICRHGTDLGDYYRSRYPAFRSWIEYIILLHDLPVSACSGYDRIVLALEKPASLTRQAPPEHIAVRNAFSQAALFFAFGSIKPDEKVSNDLHEMDSKQVVATIRKSLERNLRDLHQSPRYDYAIVSHVRHVLVRVCGPANQAQLQLFRAQVEIVDISSVFAALLGGGESVREHTHFEDLMQQVSSAWEFDRVLVNRRFIQDLAKRLSVDQWLTTTVSQKRDYLMAYII
jgi:hypothetical protein